MLANELIDQLERRGLLDQEIIEALREQLDQGGARVTPEAVAKLLVDNGQLTRFQATKLIGELRSGEYADESTVAAAEVVEEELDLIDEDSVEAIPVDAVPVEATPVEAVPVEAVPVEAVADPMSDFGGTANSDVGNGQSNGDLLSDAPDRERPRSKRSKPDPKENQWDSFKIYGFLGIIGVLLLVGGGLYWMLSRGSADDRIQAADKLYDDGIWLEAQKRYDEFLDSFGSGNEHSSKARTRIAMTQLFIASDMSDPTVATDKSEELLPTISEEEALNEERGDLAALLVKVAENIVSEASEKKDTVDKRNLLNALDRQLELTNDPQYVTGALRTSLSGKLKEVDEARGRVEREINRNEQLEIAVDEMNKLLDAKNTKAAYDVRFKLLQDYPELTGNERLAKLIAKASEIQQELVQTTAKLPELISAEPTTDQRPVVLTARSGDRVPDLRDEVIFIRTKGSVLGFNGEDGTLLWRRYVGDSLAHAPVRLEDGTAVLLTESSQLSIQRCDGRTGDVDWRVKIGEPFNQPVVVRDDVYVSTESGLLYAIDAITGDAKWAQQIPQELEVAPGVDSRAGVAYIPGNHSNLYVLGSRSGDSIESYYIGHRDGTIAVPPTPLLEHLFVIENKGSDYCLVHILGVDSDGVNLTRAQDPVRMGGNVVVPPIVAQQRRLVVLTDLGEVAVFDVEVTSENDKVSVVASQPASYGTPTLTQMAVGRSQMWTTGSRIGRFELQVNRERVVPDWSKHEGDTFIGQPLAIGDALVHARQLRGTSGIRVSAVNPQTGEEMWRNDIGAPVVMLRRIENGVHALTSQAALFELDNAAITSGATRAPVENRGAVGVVMRFEDPLQIDPERYVLINKASAEGSQQVAVYDDTRETEKLRLVTLNLLSGQPSGKGLATTDGLFLTLDTGRAVVMNYQTGSQIGSPFQPVSSPVEKVRWTNSVPVPDDAGQVVVADSRKGLYRLRVGDQIRQLAMTNLPSETLGTMAGVGNTLMAATSGPAADSIMGRNLVTLKEEFQLQLDGRVIWGPVAAGDHGMVLTDDQVLRGISKDGKPSFAVQVPKGMPVGRPVIVDGKIIVASDSGWLTAIDPASGEQLGLTQVGEPFSATPLAIGNRLLVPGAEGVVYVVAIPNEVNDK